VTLLGWLPSGASCTSWYLHASGQSLLAFSACQDKSIYIVEHIDVVTTVARIVTQEDEIEIPHEGLLCMLVMNRNAILQREYGCRGDQSFLWSIVVVAISVRDAND
jgi:hypothetical protein